MSTSEFLTALKARRDQLQAEFDAHLAAGRRFAAEDLQPELIFATRQYHNALMGR